MMKKIFLFVILCLSLNAFSQYNTLDNLYIGTKYSSVLGKVSLTPSWVSINSRKASNYGIFLRYISEKNFGIQLELNYSNEGWQEIDEDFDGYEKLDYTFRKNIKLIQIPFLFNAYLPFGQTGFKLVIEAGPDVSYITSESSDAIAGITEYKQHIWDIDNKFNYGIMGGVGIEYTKNLLLVGISGRYNYNFSNIYNDDVSDYFNTSSLQTTYISAYCAIRIHK